jgi:hypothetical protein
MSKIENYDEFWDFYVSEHSQPLNRTLHFIGTSLAVLMLVFFIWRGIWFYFPLCLIIGYGFSWVGHFFVEKNKPASFQYPFWSFISDYKMLFFMVLGRMNSEVERMKSKIG